MATTAGEGERGFRTEEQEPTIEVANMSPKSSDASRPGAPEAREPTSPSSGRRPYSKPKILLLEPLEAVAADCSVPGGKGDPTCIVGFS